MSELAFSTRAIQAGQQPDPTTGAVIPPLYLSSTFVQDGIGGFRNGYEYARGANPTRTVLETQLAALEGAAHGFAFASGLAAEDALIRAALRPGDGVVMGNDVYGGSHRLVSRIHSEWGIGLQVVDLGDLDAVAAALARPEAKLLWIESPSNPLLKITDIAALTALAHEHGARALVDNTFATPYLQQPLELGADVVVHSTTKYLGGHSDVLGGAVLLNDDALAEKVQFMQFAAGGVAGPMDAWLTTRGIRTLAVRMDRHSQNAQILAERLDEHPAVETVYYPGLPGHPGHELAARQMRAFGGIVSLSLKGGEGAARALAENAGLFTLAESLGGVESLACYPSEMTHASVKGTELAVSPAVVRLSVGIEDVEDLWASLEAALA